MKVKAEYIWIDGYEPTANLRSKTKVLDGAVSSVSELPTWGFDGSSTLQADGGDSDCLLNQCGCVQTQFVAGKIF